jgi:hypothetical protein
VSALPAILACLVGLAFLLFAQVFVAFLMKGLAWQRRNLPDPSVGLQERIVSSRALLWFLRLFGALILLGAFLSAAGLTAEGGR